MSIRMGSVAQYKQYSSTTTLIANQNADSKHVDVQGATAVAFSVSCNVIHQLGTASPQVMMADGKQVTLAPAVFPGGLDSTVVNMNAAGVIINLDLSSIVPRLVIIRPAVNTTFGFGRLFGASQAWITLTKGATVGDAIYTVVTTVYY